MGERQKQAKTGSHDRWKIKKLAAQFAARNFLLFLQDVSCLLFFLIDWIIQFIGFVEDQNSDYKQNCQRANRNVLLAGYLGNDTNDGCA